MRKSVLLFFLFACVAIALRNPDWWVHPQFVAEDGKVFFAQQLVLGPAAIFIPLNGYLHLLPRVIALLASSFPVIYQPPIFQIAGVLIAALCATFFTLPECRFVLASDHLRLAVSALVILNCNGEDLFANLAAVQVFLVPVGLILLLENRSGFFRAGLIALIALTAPALMLFLPLAVWRYVRHRNLTAGVYMLCAAIQIGLILTHPQQAAHPPHPFWLPFAAVLESWVYRVLGTVFVGVDWALFAGAHGGLVLSTSVAVIVLLALIWLRFRRPVNDTFWISMLLGPALIFEACLARPELLDLFPDLNHFTLGGGARYFFLPCCLIFVAVATVIARIGRRWPPLLQTVSLLLLFLVGIYDNYPIPKYRDLHWPEAAKKIESWKLHRDGALRVRIQPSKNALWLIGLP